MENMLASSQLHKDLKQLRCRLLRKEWLTSNIVRLRLYEPHIAAYSAPGQFINIKVTDSYVPLLRRPFSIYRVNREKQWFEILFKIIGVGTQALAKYDVDDELDVLGPLGNSFQIHSHSKSSILIAGGLGIAPLFFFSPGIGQEQYFGDAILWEQNQR